MKLYLSLAALALGTTTSSAWAACESYPNTLTNGTTANADQVMANFNCAILKSGGTFTGRIGVGSANSGGASVEARSDQNAPTVGFKVLNNSPGANAQARFDLSTYTPNSYALLGLLENGGSPYLLLSAGSAVQAAYYDMPAHIFRNSAAVEGMRITSNGNVGVGTSTPSLRFQVNGSAGGTASWSVTSDERLKDNIRSIDNALETVMHLRGVTYNWKSVSDRERGKQLALAVAEPQVGFIAQELEKFIPQAVVPPKDDADVYRIQDAKIIPYLVEAIKTQQELIKALQAQVSSLSSQKVP